jgi:hypothetical protein
VIVSGLNEASKTALLGMDFIIQRFAFTIGRFSPRRPFSSAKGDLLIADHRTEPISEQHLTIERRDDRIILSDPNSRAGSLVNNELLDVLKTHSSLGHERLSGIPDEYRFVADLTLDHHERIDGSGYPRGLKNIPEITELFGMMDFFEAVTHNRPQRGPITPYEAMRMMLSSGREGVFSPKALKAFINTFITADISDSIFAHTYSEL